MVISKNMERLVAGSSTIRKLFEEGLQMAAEVGADNVYDFSLGNPASPVPHEVRDAIEDILDNTDGNIVHGYMKNAGFNDVRKAVADSLNRKNGTDYDAEDIIMTCGAAGGMNCVFRSLLGLDDEVITFAPFFGEYRSYVCNFGGNLVVVPADTETSGVVYTEETLRKLNDIIVEAEKEIGHPIYVIADEPYRELVYGGQNVPYIPNIIKNSIFLYSFSKTLSLPGERIGYMAVSKNIDYYDEVISALVVANRCLGYINAPSLFQLVVARCLDIPANLEFYDKNRTLLYEELTNMGFEVVRPDGAFYMLIKSPTPEEDDFVAMGKKYHIILVPAKSFGCPGYVRLAYCVSNDMIKRSLPAFKKLAAEYYNI